MAFGKKARVELDTTSDEKKGDFVRRVCDRRITSNGIEVLSGMQPTNMPYCVDSHRRIKQIQDHKLVDNKNKDAVKIAQTLSSILACGNHPDKKIELICVNHDVLCCSTCDGKSSKLSTG